MACLHWEWRSDQTNYFYIRFKKVMLYNSSTAWGVAFLLWVPSFKDVVFWTCLEFVPSIEQHFEKNKKSSLQRKNLEVTKWASREHLSWGLCVWAFHWPVRRTWDAVRYAASNARTTQPTSQLLPIQPRLGLLCAFGVPNCTSGECERKGVGNIGISIDWAK